MDVLDGGIPFRLDGSTPSATVPEPASLLLFAAALGALGLQRRRKAQA